MKEFIEKLIGRFEKEKKIILSHKIVDAEDEAMVLTYNESINIVNQLAEEHKDKTIIDRRYCWQSCGATEHCKECNRLCNGSIDYYENYDFMAEVPQWKRAMMNTFLKR